MLLYKKLLLMTFSTTLVFKKLCWKTHTETLVAPHELGGV